MNSTYNLIGKGNPQWPQAFYPVENNVVIQKDDYLVTLGSPYKPFHFNVIESCYIYQFDIHLFRLGGVLITQQEGIEQHT